jgi:uncharacterized phiE125 gp8 family phage protein
MSTVVVVTPPQFEPVSLAEAKLHLRVSYDTENNLIAGLISAARDYVGSRTHRAIAQQSLRYVMDFFPGQMERYRSDFFPIERQAVLLPRPPVATVTSVKYVNPAGVLTTLASSAYELDLNSEPGRIVPTFGTFWPVPRITPGAVLVDYTAGYADPTLIPAGIKTAMLLLISHWFNNREAVAVGVIATTLEYAVEALLAPHVVKEFG